MMWTALRVLPALAFLIAGGCGANKPVDSTYHFEHKYSVRDPQFRQTMDHLWGAAAVGGNAVEVLNDAIEIFPAMLSAIRAAERSITFEAHVFWSGEIGTQFADALCERAHAGIPTHLIYDDAGSSELKAADVQAMQRAGVHLIRYNPVERLLFLFTAPEVNHRTHRKLMVIDGHVGFIGGVGISDQWLGEDGGEPWRDTMYRVEGPVVAQLQGAFMDNWMEAAREVLHGDAYFPALRNRGDMDCQVIATSPESGNADMELMYLLAMYAAERSIDIVTPYFIPDELLVDALKDARTRGVRVRVLIPGRHIDVEIARDAAHAQISQILESGVEVYEYEPAMHHAKILVVDGFWSSVGSANLDPRSLRLNDEANMNVLNEEFAQRHIDMLEMDLARSKQVTEWKHKRRTIIDHVRQFFASLFSPQL